MRIGIDAHMLGDHSGGNESYYTNILRNLVPTDDMEILLFVNKDVDVSFLGNKFRIIRFKAKSAFKRIFFELPQLCKKNKIDLLHTQYFIPFFCPCPTVCTIHDICFEHYKDIFTKGEYIRQKILIPYAAKHSCRVFTVSENAKQDISRHYNIPNEKIVVTYNAVSSEFYKLSSFERREEQIRKKFGLGNEKYVLTVGNLQPRKNLPRLIRAYSKIENSINNAKLVIVGKKAWLYNEIIQEATSKTRNIVFTDYVSTEELVQLYNAASCFVYPSFFEGFGIPPLEAMACGVPVAVANTTSLPEVVGDAGIYFDPFDENEIGNAIEKMLEPDYLTEKLKIKMVKQVNEFSWSRSAEKVLEVYKQEMVNISI